MHRLIQSIRKDFSLLLRDKVGLLLMFAMPIVLVLVITSLQNNTFKLVNDHQIRLVIFNDDAGTSSLELIKALGQSGMFTLLQDSAKTNAAEWGKKMDENDALVGLYLSAEFSDQLQKNAHAAAEIALAQAGINKNETAKTIPIINSVKLFYSPVLQESYRSAIDGAMQSSLQLIQSRKMLNSVFMAINNAEMPEAVEHQILNNKVALEKHTITSDGTGKIPNASQHNVPAWTIFAMFFMVVSLGGSLVKEKRNGSFIRLKTMPGAYLYHIFSKQIVYVIAALAQVFVIFSMGVFLFPYFGLPALNLPSNLWALLVVAIAAGLCAVSYALCLGVFAETEEQSNGFGAVSIVILAALGGILVPAFAMPEAFRIFTAGSPFYWCLEAFYQLFLNNSGFPEILHMLWPIGLFIVVLQIIAFAGMKRKNLI